MILYSSKASDGGMSILSPLNRKKFFGKIGVTERQVVNMHLAHGNKVAVVTDKDGGKLFEETDGLITNSRKTYLALLVGDCLPIAIADPITNSIGLVHAGWRGLGNGIIKNAVNEMARNFGTKPQDLVVYVGAHICKKHYEVKEDVLSKFVSFEGATSKAGRTFLDLGEIAKLQFLKLGVKNKNITIDSTCTFENKGLFSYRRNKTKDRNIYILGLLDK